MSTPNSSSGSNRARNITLVVALVIICTIVFLATLKLDAPLGSRRAPNLPDVAVAAEGGGSGGAFSDDGDDKQAQRGGSSSNSRVLVPSPVHSAFVRDVMRQNRKLHAQLQQLERKRMTVADADAPSSSSTETAEQQQSDDKAAAAAGEILLEHVPDAVTVNSGASAAVAASLVADLEQQQLQMLLQQQQNVGSFVDVYRDLLNQTQASNFVKTHTTPQSHGALTLKATAAAAAGGGGAGGVLAMLRGGTALGVKMRECNAQMKSGMYWNYQLRDCVRLEGFFAPLRPYEASVEEMSCSPDSLYEQAEPSTSSSSRPRKYRWVTFGFKDLSNPDATLQHFNIDTSAIDRAAAAAAAVTAGSSGEIVKKKLQQRYARWLFYTSWQFRQFLPWTPRPVLSPSATSKSAPPPAPATLDVPADARSNVSSGGGGAMTPLREKYGYRAFHDASVDNLYVIRNFCVAPFGGMSGYAPITVEKPSAKLDERSKFHTRDAGNWGAFFKKITVLPAPATAYDERPVIFAPRLAYSHPNIHHVLARFVGLLGILDLPAFSRNIHEPEPSASSSASSNSEFTAGSTTEHWNADQGLKPLVVFVFTRMTRKKLNADRVRVSPWAFFLRALDLPVATVNARSDTDDFMADVFKLSRHSPAAAAAVSSSSSASASSATQRKYHDTGSLCFQRGVIYQNCHPSQVGRHVHCDWKYPHGDLEEYSFGAFSKLTAPKQATLRHYLRLLHNCLPVRGSTGNWSGAIIAAANPSSITPFYPPRVLTSQSPLSALPNIMINVRASQRTLAHLPLLADELRSRLVAEGFAAKMAFAEPWRGSRAEYVDAMRESDIFLGVHGGAMSEVVLLRPRPVVVEIQSKLFACREAGCWFGMSVDAPLGAHWIVQTPQQDNAGTAGAGAASGNASKTFHVPANVLVDLLRDAVCKWLALNHMAAPNEKVRVYCKLFAPRVEGGSRYRSTLFLDRNGAAGFPTDVRAVERALRDEFGLELSPPPPPSSSSSSSHKRRGKPPPTSFDAVRLLVERLRSVGTRVRGERVLEPGALRSEAPLFFQTLLQRFVDVSLTVAPQQKLGGAYRQMEPVVCLDVGANGGEASQACLYQNK